MDLYFYVSYATQSYVNKQSCSRKVTFGLQVRHVSHYSSKTHNIEYIEMSINIILFSDIPLSNLLVLPFLHNWIAAIATKPRESYQENGNLKINNYYVNMKDVEASALPKSLTTLFC